VPLPLVLVDTSVWSLALRRRADSLNQREKKDVAELTNLIEEGRAQLIGPIRQEILSGIREASQYARLRRDLSSFADSPIESDDFEFAARLSNRCRAAGIAGSPVDFLICAVALKRDWPVFTTDHDFVAYGKLLGVKLHASRA
jgi:predicted nucleic acid-binding protein